VGASSKCADGWRGGRVYKAIECIRKDLKGMRCEGGYWVRLDHDTI
jgi:hypothetical protein